MKDGEAFASKYDSQQLKIRVPNVVMVFSNSPPDVRELAKVRFRVFNINNNQLQKKNIVEIKDPKEKKENAESDSDVDSVLSNLLVSKIPQSNHHSSRIVLINVSTRLEG